MTVTVEGKRTNRRRLKKAKSRAILTQSKIKKWRKKMVMIAVEPSGLSLRRHFGWRRSRWRETMIESDGRELGQKTNEGNEIEMKSLETDPETTKVVHWQAKCARIIKSSEKIEKLKCARAKPGPTWMDVGQSALVLHFDKLFEPSGLQLDPSLYTRPTKNSDSNRIRAQQSKCDHSV